MADALFLQDGASSTVNVHPVALFSVLDHHMRRQESQDRVIGALLGHIHGGVVEITNSFAVHHIVKGNEVQVRRMSVMDSLALHKRVNDKEMLVGWYSTWATPGAGHPIDDFTTAVHQFFAECAVASGSPRQVHLLVDVSLARPTIGVHAYVTVNNNLLKNLMIQFQQLKVAVVASTEERVGIDAMVKSAFGRDGGASAQSTLLGEVRDVIPDVEALETSMRRLKSMLDKAADYVEGVMAGKHAGDEAVGRAISDALAAVPTLDAGSFDRSFNKSLQDLLMVTYLGNLTQVQVKLAERIAQLPQTQTR